jgi:hypothetical protein
MSPLSNSLSVKLPSDVDPSPLPLEELSASLVNDSSDDSELSSFFVSPIVFNSVLNIAPPPPSLPLSVRVYPQGRSTKCYLLPHYSKTKRMPCTDHSHANADLNNTPTSIQNVGRIENKKKINLLKHKSVKPNRTKETKY